MNTSVHFNTVFWSQSWNLSRTWTESVCRPLKLNNENYIIRSTASLCSSSIFFFSKADIWRQFPEWRWVCVFEYVQWFVNDSLWRLLDCASEASFYWGFTADFTQQLYWLRVKRTADRDSFLTPDYSCFVTPQRVMWWTL